jgi:hypothetical protein
MSSSETITVTLRIIRVGSVNNAVSAVALLMAKLLRVYVAI